MKQFKTIGMVIICLCAFSLVFAESQPEFKKDGREIMQDSKEIKKTVLTFNNLSIAIDYWHDANLKADRKAVSKHLKTIYDIIDRDIKDSYRSASYAKLESTYSKNEMKEKHSSPSAKKDDVKEFVDDKHDQSVQQSYVKSKQHLYKALKQSKSFGFQYRLLADYQQLLKKEMEFEKIELAEDFGEFNEDSRIIRRK